VLKSRVTDTNKAVQSLALDIVGRIAIGMGKPFEKQARFFVAPLVTVLSDQKASVRALATQTLTAIAAACDSLEAMVPGLASGLETSNPLQKGTLLQWINTWISEHQPPPSLDLSTWALSIVSSLDDRNGEVRKGAQAILPVLITYAGYDYVMQQSSSLKPASRTTAVPLIQSARGDAAVEPVSKTAPAKPAAPPLKPAQKETASAVNLPPTPTDTSLIKPAPKTVGIRRKLPVGGSRPDSRAESSADATAPRMSKAPLGISRAVPPSKSAPASSSPSYVLTGANPDSRKARIGRDAGRWIIEPGPVRKDLVELLHTQMEGPGSKELVTKLFSQDHNAVNDYIAGLNLLQELYSGALESDDPLTPVCVANFDLPLRYISIRVHEPQSNLVMKCLDVADAVLSFLRLQKHQLTDLEAVCFVPTLVNKARLSQLC
jgi:cytoskeleton-associated protein 5